MFEFQRVSRATAYLGWLILLSGGTAAHVAVEPDSPGLWTQPWVQRSPDPAAHSVVPKVWQTTQVFWNYEAYRQQRLQELEAARRERHAQRQAERERWREQRGKARLDAMEREQTYREESRKHHPELEKHRRRYTRELQQRRQAGHERRLERWRRDDVENQ